MKKQFSRLGQLLLRCITVKQIFVMLTLCWFTASYSAAPVFFNGDGSIILQTQDDFGNGGQLTVIAGNFIQQNPGYVSGTATLYSFNSQGNPELNESQQLGFNPVNFTTLLAAQNYDLTVVLYDANAQVIASDVVSFTVACQTTCAPYLFFRDADGDGYGNPAISILAYLPPPGYVPDNSDCNDNDPTVNTGAAEVCNGIDDDCDGQIDEGLTGVYACFDADGDGHGAGPSQFFCNAPPAGWVSLCDDCDDTNASIYPGAPEVCNGIDDDCDGQIDEGLTGVYACFDADGDGHGAGTPQFFCNAPPAGWVSLCDDCDDTNASIYPGAAEVINNLDDDCNGIVDDVPCTTAPAKPGTISGPVHGVCAGSENIVYCISPVNGATTYVWTIPSNSIIVSGQGTTSLTLNFTVSFVSGQLKVQSQNACGTSAFRKITIQSIPVVANIQGTASGYCGGANNVVFSVAANSGATSYEWTVPAGIILVSGQGTNSITVNIDPSFISGLLCITATNSCGTKVKCKTITATPSTPAVISGAKNPCIGAIAVYSISAIPGADSYNWVVPAGWVINSGQGTTSINVLIGSDAGKIKVTAVNECGYSAERKKMITPVSCRMNDEDEKFEEEHEVGSTLLSPASVYPNPSFGEFNLSFTAKQESMGIIAVYDLTGNMIYDSEIEISSGENNYRLDLSEFSAGVYILNLNYGNQIETLKLIKQ